MSDQPEKMLGGITGKGFMPGESGNPGGRPKKKPVTEILEEIFGSDNKEFIKKQLLKVMGGKSGMAKVLLMDKAAERIEGKVEQSVQINGDLNVTTISEKVAKARARKNHKI